MNTKQGGMLLALAVAAGLSLSDARGALIAKYTFNEGGGAVAYDTSGVGAPADGALSGGANAPSLSANPGYIDFGSGGGGVNFGLPAKLTSPSSFTIETWVKDIVEVGEAPIFGQSYYTVGITRYSGKYYSYAKGASSTIAFPEPETGSGEHMVAITYDSAAGKLSFYFDGAPVSDATYPATGPIAFNGNNFISGAYGSGDYMKGMLDQINYYDSALSSAQISADHTTGPDPVPEPAALGALALGGMLMVRRGR